MQVLDPDEIAAESISLANQNNVATALNASPLSEAQSEPETAFDGVFLLGSLQHPTWRLHQPVRLNISRSDDQIVLEWPEGGNIFGYGDRLSSAVVDFRLALVDLYETIVETDPNSLGPDMLALRATLQRTIGPTIAA